MDQANVKRIAIAAGAGLLVLLVAYIAFEFYRQSQISESERLFQAGDYQTIIEEYAPLIEGQEGRPDEHILLARALFRLRRFEEASQVLQPYLQYGQVDPRAVALSGWIALEQDSFLAARDHFTTLESRGEEALANLGFAAVTLAQNEDEGYSTQQLQDARFRIQDALNALPDRPRTHITAAQLYLVEHNFSAAIDAAQKAADLAPHWSAPYSMLGRAYMQNGQFDQAETALQQSLERGGSPEVAEYYLARSIYRQGRLAEARALLLELAEDESPIQRDAVEDAARIHLALGELAEAETLLKRSYQMQESPVTGMLLYQVLERQDKDVEASQLLEEILASRPFVVDARLERAHQYYRSGESERAYREYQSVRDYDPTNPLASYNLGYLAMDGQAPHLAPDYLQTALEAYEDYYPAKVNLVLARIGNQLVQEARPVLETLAETYGGEPHVRLAQALERFASGETEGAITWLTDLPEDQQSALLPLLLGEIRLRLHLYSMARQAFLQALELESNLTRAQLGATHAALRLGWLDSAQEEYQRLLNRTEPLAPETRVLVENALALAEWQSEERQSARDRWTRISNESDLGRKLAEINQALLYADAPTSQDIDQLEDLANQTETLPETFYNLGWMQNRVGNTLAAIRTYQNMLVAYPRYLPALMNLGALLQDQRQYDQALTIMQRAERLAPERVDLQNNLAAVHLDAGSLEAAQLYLDQAGQQAPEEALVRVNRSLLHIHQGNRTEAVAELESLRELEARPAKAALIEGLLAAQQGNWQEAAAHFRRSRELDGSDPYAVMNLGIALSQTGQDEAAQQALQASLNLDPQFADGYKALGLFLAQRGKYRPAMSALQQSLRYRPAQDDLRAVVEQLQGWLSQARDESIRP